MAEAIVTSTLDTLTAKSTQLAALLAEVPASPEALENVSSDERAACLWAFHELASEVQGCAADLAVQSARR